MNPRFLRALRGIGQDCLVLTDEEQRAPYTSDALTVYRIRPLAVVLPGSESQVKAVVEICHRFKVPLVSRGAGTGLSGGATPVSGGIVLSLARLNRIIRVDPQSRTATVQAGVRNTAISDAAAPHGLYYAPDPSSQIACTIGGNVAENSGGVHCLKYGLTVHNVLRVRCVTSDGEIVEFGSCALDSPGLDLLAVLIGSEGMFAVITEVTVKLIPKPQHACLVAASFASVKSAGDAVAAIIAAGIIPAGLEMMDHGAIVAVDAFAHAGYDCTAAAILLCEADGTAEEVAAEIAHVSSVLKLSGSTRLHVAADEAERLRLWSGRKNAFPAAGRISPDYYCMDGTVPRRKIGELLEHIEMLGHRHDLRCINVFHAGDGNMHPLILFDASDAAEWKRAEAFGADILEQCVRLGGTITGEHGVGLEKLDSMCVQFSPAERDAFLAVKHAFDPAELLNPGKGIPTRSRCAEYGRMHVHKGELPFADLPRF